MIVLSEVSQPSEGVRVVQPQVQAYFENDCSGDGTLTISESCVTWINRESKKGFSLTYPSIILHALSTDLSSFPQECIYVLVDCSKAERRGRRPIPLYTQAEAENVQDLNLADDELNGAPGEDNDSEDAPNVSIRFVPTDTSALRQIYDEMSACQELNPDEDDISEGEECPDEIEEMMMEGGDATQGGRWFTAESMAEMGDGGGDFALSEEGMANLQRMMGGGGGANGSAHGPDEDNEEMDH